MIDLSEAQRVTNYLTPLLGCPYKINGQNKSDGFDCWSLTRLIQRDLWFRNLEYTQLPESGNIRDLVRIIKEHPGHRDWRVVEKPVHSGIVELSCSKQPHHIGTWLDIDGGGLIHCNGPAGVSFDPLVALKAAGWRRFIFYEWAG